MLSTFSYTCWPFVCFLGKTSIQFLSAYFNCVICSFDVVCMISLCSFNINLFSDGWFANILSHSIGYLFILLTVSLAMQRLLRCSFTCLLLLLWLVLLLSYSRNHSGRSGGLGFPSVSEFSTVCCDPHSQRLWHSQ